MNREINEYMKSICAKIEMNASSTYDLTFLSNVK